MFGVTILAYENEAREKHCDFFLLFSRNFLLLRVFRALIYLVFRSYVTII